MAPVAMAAGRAWSLRRPSVASLSSYIVCPLCRGYLIDATTITRCFHSFCRSCIVRHLKRNNFCPTCRTISPSTDICPTVKKLRSDRILQTLIYKLIPGLFEDESRRRKEHRQSNNSDQGLGEGVVSVTESGRLSEEREKQRRRVLGGGGRSRMASLIYAGHESINVCLQYCDKFPPKQNTISVGASGGQKGKDKEESTVSNGCRYLLCPAFITMGHLKKFLQLKFDLDENCEIDIFHSEESLPNDYTLVDLAYIFHCRKIFDMTLQYVIWEKGTTLLSVEDLQRRSEAKSGPSSCASNSSSSSSFPYLPVSFATSSTSSPVRIRRCRRRRTQLEILGILRSNANENKTHLQLRSGCAVQRTTQPEASASTLDGSTGLTDEGVTTYGKPSECGALEKQIMTIAIRAEEPGGSDDDDDDGGGGDDDDDEEVALNEFGLSGNLLSDVAHLEQSIVGFSKGYSNSDCEVSLDFAPTEHLPVDLSNSSEFSMGYGSKPSEGLLRSISDAAENVQLENVRTKVLELVETRISDLESVLFDEIGIGDLVDSGNFDDVSTGYRKTGYMTSQLPGIFHIGSNDGNQRRLASNDVTLFGAIQGNQSTLPTVRNLQHLTDADIDREIRSLAADLALRTRSENGCGYRTREDEDTPTSPMTIPGDESPPDGEVAAKHNDDRPSLSNGGCMTIAHDVSMGVDIGEKTEDDTVSSHADGVWVASSATCSDETAADVSIFQHHDRLDAGFLDSPGQEPLNQLPAVSDQFTLSKAYPCMEGSRSLISEGFHANAGLESYLTGEAEARSAKVAQLSSTNEASPETCQTQQNVLVPVISAESQNCATFHKENGPLTSKERIQNQKASVANVPSRVDIVPSNETGDKMRSEVSGTFFSDSTTLKENSPLRSSKCVSTVISEKNVSNRNVETLVHGNTGSSGSLSESGPSKVSSESLISPSSTNITVSSSFPTTTLSPSVSTSHISAQEKLSVGTQTNPDLLRRYFKRKSKPLGLFTSPKTSTRKTRQQNRPSAIAPPAPETYDTPNPSPSVYSISTAASQSPTSSVRLNSYLSERHRLRYLRPASPRPNASASSASSVSFASPSTFYPPIGINGTKSTLLITLPAAGGAVPPTPSTAGVRPSLTIIGSNLSLSGCSVAAGTALTPILIQASGISQGLPLQLLIPNIASSMANRSSTTTTVTSAAVAAKRETETLGAVSSSTAEDDLPSTAATHSICSDAGGGDSVIDSSTQSHSQSNSPELEQKLQRGRSDAAPSSRPTATGSTAKTSSLLSSTLCQSTSRLKSNISKPDSKPRRMPSSRLTVRNTTKSVEPVGAPLVARTGILLSNSVSCMRLKSQQQLQHPPASRCSVNQKRLVGSSRLESLLMDKVLSTKGGNHLSVPVLRRTPASSAIAMSSSASSVSVTFSQGTSSAASDGHCHSASRTKAREGTTFCGWSNQLVKTPTTETQSISVRGNPDVNSTVAASSLSAKRTHMVRGYGSPALHMTSSTKTAKRTLGNSSGNLYGEGRYEHGTANRLISGKILHLAPASLIHAILDQKLQQPDAELFDSSSSVISTDALLSSSRHASVPIHGNELEMNGRQSDIAANQKTLIPSITTDDDRQNKECLPSEVQPLIISSAQSEHLDTWATSAFCRSSSSRPDVSSEKKSSGKTCRHDDGCNSEHVIGCNQRKCHCFRSQPISKVLSTVEQSSCADKSDKRRKVINSCCEAVRISSKVDVFNRSKVSSPSSSSSSSSPCVVAWSGSAVESPISISSSVVATDSSSNPSPEDSYGGGGVGGGGNGEEKDEEATSVAAAPSTAPKITPVGADEKGQMKANNHKSDEDAGACAAGRSRPQETDLECLTGSCCSDAIACPPATQLNPTTGPSQDSQQPQSIDDWMPARKLFWRTSPGQATKCGAIALPKKVYAYLGSALSKEHLSARRLTAADDQTAANPSQPSSVSSKRNPTQDTSTPSMASESISTPPPTPFYLVPQSSSSENISAPPIKQLRLMCSGIPYASEATSMASNSPPAAAAAAQQPKRKPKKKKSPTESSECRRTPRIRRNESRVGSGQKNDYAGTRLTCNPINSFARDHRLPVADGRLLTR